MLKCTDWWNLEIQVYDFKRYRLNPQAVGILNLRKSIFKILKFEKETLSASDQNSDPAVVGWEAGCHGNQDLDKAARSLAAW